MNTREHSTHGNKSITKPESKTLTAQQSLDLIAQMIRQAQGKVQRNNFYFLFWGWVIAIANLGMYILTQMHYERPYIPGYLLKQKQA